MSTGRRVLLVVAIAAAVAKHLEARAGGAHYTSGRFSTEPHQLGRSPARAGDQAPH